MRPKNLFSIVLAFGIILTGCKESHLTTTSKFENSNINKGQSNSAQQTNVEIIKSGHINIKGLDVSLNEISFNSPYVVPTSGLKVNPDNEFGYDQKYIYASEKRIQLAILTKGTVKIKSEANQPAEEVHNISSIEIFDANGAVLWKTEKIDSLPNRLYLSDDGKYNHIIWSGQTDDQLTWISYDKQGNELLKVNNIGRIEPSEYNDIVYYRLLSDEGKRKVTNVLYCYNFNNNEKWEKPFETKKQFRENVSRSGNRVICLVDSDLYSLNQHGDLLWKKRFPIATGVTLSNDGSVFTRAYERTIELYSNATLDLLSKIEIADTDMYGLCIVNNSVIAVNTSNYANKCAAYFYNFNGKLEDTVNIKCGSFSFYVNETMKGYYSVYADGVKVLDYKIK